MATLRRAGLAISCACGTGRSIRPVYLRRSPRLSEESPRKYDPEQFMSSHFEDRRRALAKFVVGGMGLVGAALASLVGLVAAPRGAASTSRWRKAASVSDVPADAPFTAVLGERHLDGWMETRKQSIVF